MRGPSVRGVKAEYIACFALGIIFLVLGVYGLYYLVAVELPSGRFSKLPFASIGCIILGVIIIRQSYPIFIAEKNHPVKSKVCPFCGALVDEYADVCEKCKGKIEN